MSRWRLVHVRARGGGALPLGHGGLAGQAVLTTLESLMLDGFIEGVIGAEAEARPAWNLPAPWPSPAMRSTWPR
jgi:hypothetical protein